MPRDTPAPGTLAHQARQRPPTAGSLLWLAALLLASGALWVVLILLLEAALILAGVA